MEFRGCFPHRDCAGYLLALLAQAATGRRFQGGFARRDCAMVALLSASLLSVLC